MESTYQNNWFTIYKIASYTWYFSNNLQKIPPTFNKIEIMHKHVYTFVYQKLIKQKWLQWQVIWAVFCQFSIKIDFSLDFAPWYKWHYAYRGNLTWHHFYNHVIIIFIKQEIPIQSFLRSQIKCGWFWVLDTLKDYTITPPLDSVEWLHRQYQ